MEVGDVESLVAHRVAVLRVDAPHEGEKDEQDGEGVQVVAGHVVHAQHLKEGKDGSLVGGHQVTQPDGAHRPDPLLNHLHQRKI